jgi:hypothetical protein
VCLSQSPLPPTGGWVPVRCSACGTDFVATDGSPPPVAPAIPEAPVAHSPIAPTSPLGPREPTSDLPRSFTSDVRIDAAGRRRVTCPQCRRADVMIPRHATVAIVLRCPVCHDPFLINLDSSPPAPLRPSIWERIRRWFRGR